MGGALQGIRVLEIASYVTGPFASLLLADLGADVVKIEPPSGNSQRRSGPFPGGEPDPERSGLFLYLNVNKRGGALSSRGCDAGCRNPGQSSWKVQKPASGSRSVTSRLAGSSGSALPSAIPHTIISSGPMPSWLRTISG